MSLNLVVVTPPTAEPVSTTNAKLQMRVDASTEDALIAIYITAARELCEEITRRAFITQTLRLSLDGWPDESYIILPRPPLQSVTHIKYTDSNGVLYTMDSNSYVVDTDSSPARIVLKSGYAWPGESLQSAGAIKITYVAGYGAAAANVPQKYCAAVQLLAAHLYENREAVSDGALTEVPFGVKALLTGDKGWY